MWLYKLIIIAIIVQGDDFYMKKILMLIILVLVLVVNCSYFEGSERARRERGRECTYNSRGEAQVCGYIK